MTDTTKKMLETAHILDGQIIDAIEESIEFKSGKCGPMLDKVHQNLHEAINILIELATEEELEKA